jgi:hypothetical protein
VAVDAETDGVNGFTELASAAAVDTFTISSSTYAIVASNADDGVQIINMTNPANIVAVDAETDGVNGFTELLGPRGVDTFTISSSTYAIVSSNSDDGVQIINMTDPANIVAVDAETDGVNGFTELAGAWGVNTFTISSSTYALVGSNIDNGVQLINMTNPADIVAVNAETDGVNGFTTLAGSRGVDTFTISSSTYAIVTGNADDGVQIIKMIYTVSPTDSIGITDSISTSVTSPTSTTENSGGGGSGDKTPPSFTGFSESILQINDYSFTADDLEDTQNKIIAYQDQPVRFAVTLFDNEGPNNIRHIDLFLNRQGETILNDLTDTYVEYHEDKITIFDPHEIIQSASVTRSQDGSKAVFVWEVVFSGQMETSDVLIRAWDARRNVSYLHANDIISVISKPASEPIQMQDVPKKQDVSVPSQTQDTSEQDKILRQWAGYYTESATDEQLLEAVIGEKPDSKTLKIPRWIKGDVAKWYVSGSITYDEFAVVIKYVYYHDVLTDSDIS